LVFEPIYLDDDGGVEWGDDLPTLPDDLDALTDRQVAVLLRNAISAYSEQWWCARWLAGVEFIAWHLDETPPGDVDAFPEEVAVIGRLKQRLGGAWVMWQKSAAGEGVHLIDAETWELERAMGVAYD
jgi:hypothetical protein